MQEKLNLNSEEQEAKQSHMRLPHMHERCFDNLAEHSDAKQLWQMIFHVSSLEGLPLQPAVFATRRFNGLQLLSCALERCKRQVQFLQVATGEAERAWLNHLHFAGWMMLLNDGKQFVKSQI